MMKAESNSSLEDDLKAMRIAIGDAIDSWAVLEHDLSQLFEKLLDGPSGIGTHLYYAPTNTETRLKLVNSAIMHQGSVPMVANQAQGCWKRLYKLIGRAKSSRNKIAHGHTIIFNQKAVRLMPYLHNWIPNKQSDMPGHSVHDVTQMGEGFRVLYRYVREMTDIVSNAKQAKADSSHDSTLVDKLLSLAGRLQISQQDRIAHNLPSR